MKPTPPARPPEPGGPEILVGRFLAWCVHPVAAWNAVSASQRMLIAAGYFAAAYGATFASLRFLPRL